MRSLSNHLEEQNMKQRELYHFLCIAIILALTACVPSKPDVNPTATQVISDTSATQTAAIPTASLAAPTTTVAPLPNPTEEASLTPATTPTGATQFIAYIRDGHLLVTDVTNGVQGGTTQYTLAGE